MPDQVREQGAIRRKSAVRMGKMSIFDEDFITAIET